MASTLKDLEERTKRMRDRAKRSLTTYKITAGISHANISGTIVGGGKNDDCELSFGAPENPTTIRIREELLNSWIDFLTYAREECKVLRERYAALEGTA